jgi:hypothetical protein
LLEKGVDINAFNMQFESPAILAAKNNDPKTLTLLLEKGANDLERIDTVEGKNVYKYAEENSCKRVMDDFKKRQEVVEPLSAPVAKPSLLRRIGAWLLAPFGWFGSVLRSIAAAVVQFFVDRSSKPRRPSDPSDGSEDIAEDQGVFNNIDNPQTITKLTSASPQPEEVRKRRKYRREDEKKVHLFTDAELQEARRQGELQVRGVSPPPSPGTKPDSPRRGEI